MLNLTVLEKVQPLALASAFLKVVYVVAQSH